ncbi:hypothetical protein [Phenylobacterium sp.]|uniref:hypothetical protein n=1 Tax=Phenylobacterium sp. TaxID=1871053 RepID=UPI002FE3FCD5
MRADSPVPARPSGASGACASPLTLRDVLSPDVRNATAALAIGATFLSLLFTAACFGAMAASGVLRARAPWASSRGPEFWLRLDGFTWMFRALSAAPALLENIYARYCMSSSDPAPGPTMLRV